MPYCGRCLNVGKAGKRGAPSEYGPTSTVVCLLCQAQPTPNRASIGNDDRGYYRLCQEPCEREMAQDYIHALVLVHEDLPDRAPASSAVVTTTAKFGITMSSSIACTSASGSAQQSRTTTKR